MSSRPGLFLVVSLDVEEEGLFSGGYARRGTSTTNTSSLARLTPLFERGIRPTLFCAHSIFADPESCRHLATLRDRHPVEIGAHLHHWNTPPLTEDGSDASLPDTTGHVPSAAVPLPLMAAKLQTLFTAGQAFQGAPLTSFRMGRWDLHRRHWPLLAEIGVRCDASVRPLHCGPTATDPDHFFAPADPYWIQTGRAHIFEVPLTVTPLLPSLPLRMRGNGRMTTRCRESLHAWGALALLPVYHPLWAMKAVTRLYAGRGGQVLSLTWHSSEMHPGATPHLPDSASVDRLLAKIAAYIDWLATRWTIRCVSITELCDRLGPSTNCPASDTGDWTDTAKTQTGVAA